MAHHNAEAGFGKLEIVRLMEPGVSVAEIARLMSEGEPNSSGVTKTGQLGDAGTRPTALLPVTISADGRSIAEPAAAGGKQTSNGGAILRRFRR